MKTLAILMANTDVSSFADKHPKDGEKFTQFIKGVRPDWQCDIFNVVQSVFPENLVKYDGFIITGSPASVNDESAWIGELESCVRDIHRQNKPLFGACFGHQIIAKALGGMVSKNPDGFVLGAVIASKVTDVSWTAKLPDMFPLYAAHQEQVTTLPEMAIRIAQNPTCPNAGFVIGRGVYTTQYHPEMTPHFIEALTSRLSSRLGSDVIMRAEASLKTKVDRNLFAESVAQFFEK